MKIIARKTHFIDKICFFLMRERQVFFQESKYIPLFTMVLTEIGKILANSESNPMGQVHFEIQFDF